MKRVEKKSQKRKETEGMITNRAIRAVTVSGIAVFLLWNGVPVWGQEAVSPVRDPQSAMEEIDRKIGELQQQKETLQRQAEQLEVLSDLQNQARDRRDEMGGELNEIANAEETTCPAAKAQREARKLHLETQTKAISDILAAKDSAAMPKVREILAQMADRDLEWDIVIAPRHDTAVMLAELETQATSEEGTDAQRKLLDRIRALCKENAAAREAQLKAAKATASNAREIEKLVEQFRSGH
jgi:DNA repair exonuclease SbcCD ATPase subunit